MAQAIMNHQSTRVLLVAAGSAAAFIGLGFLIYWVYFINREAVYDRRLDEGLATLQVLFYTAFAIHMLGSSGAAVALTKWKKAPIYPTFAVVGLIFVILTTPMLFLLTGLHLCVTGESFPIPGLPNKCD